MTGITSFNKGDTEIKAVDVTKLSDSSSIVRQTVEEFQKFDHLYHIIAFLKAWEMVTPLPF
jgi:enoyl-[acyl-carrier-protein] reductase (NADH)